MSECPTALEALERHFGFNEFRDGQEPVIAALLEGKDALVVMPTGGGKSLCYQLPALVKEGVTIVVSPLIALMKDQVDALLLKGVPAAMINSTQNLDEQRDRLRALRAGEIKLLYIAPERFRAQGFRAALSEVAIGLFAVDEAHCLSQWGHDFRPDYLRLEQTLEELGRPQTAAFTATATPHVRDDILSTLKLRDPFVSISGFERPNLSLRVRHVNSAKEKRERLGAILEKWKTGIVYCATRRKVEEVSESLADSGARVIAYHGGMSDQDREYAQNCFLRGDCDVAVATNAFGMGIDRADVRFVVHFDVPGSIEAYYQEAGRAGRDREPAICELLFNFADTGTQEFFVEGNNPGPSLIRQVYSALAARADEQQVVVAAIRDVADWAEAKNSMSVGSALSVLGRAGYVQRFDVAGTRVRGTRLLRPGVGASDIELDEEALAAKAKADHAKLDAIIKFCYSQQCRQQWIMRYFGERSASKCGSCDQCRSEDDGRKREPTDSEVVLVQKALSGVARMSYRNRRGWVARFGRGKIIGMLVGSRAADILAGGFDRLTTYGLFKTEGQAYLYALFNELEEAGLIQREVRNEYPLITLTAEGVAAMKGAADYRLNWPKPKKAAKKKAPPEPVLEAVEFDPELYEKLKAKRVELAAAEGGKPAYTVFSNQTLESFTRYRPQTIEEGLTIHGVGQVKAERYLLDFIEVIRAHPIAQASD